MLPIIKLIRPITNIINGRPIEFKEMPTRIAREKRVIETNNSMLPHMTNKIALFRLKEGTLDKIQAVIKIMIGNSSNGNKFR